jgi:acyl-CoA reductase-like NAD-dependent aldehyde dehydrogenase
VSETQSSTKVWHLSVAGGEARGPDDRLVPISPVDGRPLEPVAAAGEAEVRAAVARARVAQEEWKLVSLQERARMLKRAATEMLVRREEAIELAALELGKVEIEGLFNEALGPLETLAGWVKVVGEATATRSVRLNPISFPRKTAEVEMVPRGVVGIIAAWNFPVAGLYRSTFPALLTGNAVVVKPSEFTPRTSAWFVERLAAALPDGLVQLVQGSGAVGAALIDAGIDACVFTGSPASGRKVRVRCAERGIPASVEMGGKDAAIVLADCDLVRTVAGITHWAISNVGQSCGAIEVAYVDQRIADSFVTRLADAWRRIRLGSDRHADLGPLGNRRQFDIVAAQVADARGKGAKVVCGGEAGGPTNAGFWFPPTLLDGCTDEMAVVRDETFGPVLAVVRVSGADEAIRKVNAARYGLGASIWTSDLPRARRLASRLDVGVVTINNHSFSGAIPKLPWSGTRETGTGIANGPEALATYVRPRTVVVDAAGGFEPYWLPYDHVLWELGSLVADAQLGKLGQVWKLPLLFRERSKTLKKFFK